MKKVYTLFIICTVFICTLSFCPVSAFQEDSFTDSQYEQIGSLGLGHLISDGQIDELDFSSGTGEVGFLVALGKSIVTKDPTYILEYGLNWATAKAQEILQSLEDWFSLNFPDLYEFFTGVKTEIKYNPMPLETRRGFTQLLKDRVSSPDPVTPDPDVNYAPYLLLINGNTGFTSWYQSDFYLTNYSPTSSNISSHYSLQLVPSEFSFITKDYIYNVNRFNYNSYKNIYVSYINTNYYGSTQYACQPITIYINHAEGSENYVVTTSNLSQLMCIYDNRDGSTYSSFNYSYSVNNNTWSFSTSYDGMSTLPTFLYTGSLENCFKIISMNFRNVDIYVDGNLWATGSFTSDNSLIYPIGIPDNFEILSGVPGSYYYPSDSYWNLDGLVQLIKQAISEYGVISISDIAPLIVDINGVQAVRTTNVARTDYDNLISEQYSIYPDDTVLQVPNVVLDNGEIISFVVTSSGSNLIPDDIMLVLCGGGILLLIGFLINRMLE